MTTRGALETRRLTFAYGRTTVLRRVDLRIDCGQTVALLGKNGSGKTTLLRCLAGVLRPDSGDLAWFGRSPWSSPDMRREIGVAAHQHFLYPELTPRENLLLTARMYDVANPHGRAEELLRDAGLLAWSSKPTASLSHGLRQRLAVSRALVHKPRIVLFDEPFSGLDSSARDWLADVFQKLKLRRAAVCFTTHDAETARRLADQVGHLERGQVVWQTGDRPAARSIAA